MYKQFGEQDAQAIARLVGEANVICRQAIGEDYSHDEMGGVTAYPDLLVKVHSTEDVSRVMSYAYEQNIPVVVRGSGTGLVGACVAIHGGIMLDTTEMNHILELDEKNLTITVEPGVLLMDLAKYAEDHDFLYPPDPGEKSATIGGNISTNAGGMRAVKYGVTRDYVRALTVVMPDGQVLELGGKVVKNSTGYALKDLVIGSEGTLAVITQAVLKLIPLPQYTVSLLVPFSDFAAGISTVPKIIQSKCQPTAIEFMERDTLLFSEQYLGKKFPDTQAPAYLLLTFDGSSLPRICEEYEAVARLCLAEGASDVFLVDTEERKASVWSARGAFLEAIKASTTEMDECDVVVPRDKVADFIIFTHQLAKELRLRIPSFGHAGDGNLHVYLCRDGLDEKTWTEKREAAFNAMYERSRQLLGQVSGEHGIGYAKKGYMAQQVGQPQLELMQRIKAAFDPKNILNPDKVVR